MKRMKRWISALLVLCLFLSLVPVRAEADTLTAMPETVDTVDGLYSNREFSIAPEAGLVETEQDRIGLLNNGATDYRQWSQGDSRWGSIGMGTSTRTIASHGCLVTSITKLIIQAGFRSSDSFTVATFANWMNNNTGYVPGSASMYWAKPSECISGFVNHGALMGSGSYSSSGYNAQLLDYIKQGYHLVIAVKSEGHWVAVDEAKSIATGTIYIMDSLSSGANADITLASRYSTFNRVQAYKGGSTPNATVSCTCSTSYAGDYICTTASANLNIRSGHGTGFDVVGSIPSGATVYVSKASGTGAGHWGHVEYNGVSGYASMEYLALKGTGSTPQGVIQWWMSDSEYGDSVSEFKVGNRYYFCYRLYDSVSGKDWDEVTDDSYSVKLTIYNPDGSERFSNTTSSDSSWISIFYTEPGTYTREVVLSGDINFSGSREFTVQENPLQIYASTGSVDLTLGGTESDVICAWDSGYYADDYVFSWSRSNSNVSCSWGEWTDGLLPLTITANSVGTTTITLSVKDAETKAVLDSCTVNVTVDAKTYTVSYNANGGSGAPSSQTKTHGTDLTLSSTIPTRFGYTFLGWSTSSSATTASYTAGGSYTANAGTTLYAVWAAATEISGNYAGFTRAATISNPGAGVYYKFTPYTTTYYRIYGTDDLDTRVYLYDASGNQLAANDDGNGNQFLLDYHFTSGETYYIYVRFYGSGQTGTLDFKVAYGYRINYSANGGSGAPGTTYKYYNFDTTLSTVTPTRSGYTFLGWASSSSATAAEYQPGDTFSTNTNTTLYAVWDQNTYTVTYNANGGSGAPSSQTKTGGTALTLSTTQPTRFGYTFLGWSTSSSATSAAYLPGGSFTTDANTTLYAVWQSASTISASVTSSSYSAAVSFSGGYKYYSFTPSFSGKVQFESSGSSDTIIYLYDSSGNQLATNDDSGDGTNFLLTYAVTSGTKYYAKVKYYGSTTGTISFTVKRAYDITYHANGGSGAPSAQVKVYGTSLTLSSTTPTRSGYTFLGWSTSSTATTATYQPGGSFTTNANTTLYAVWRAGTYTISYNANGGSGAPSSQTKTHGVTLTLSSTVPTRSGYTFLGWSTSSTATTATYQPGGSFTTNANTTLYAVWQAGTYTISYNANGGSGAPASQTKTHGVTLTLSSTVPTRSGYTFLGWSTSSTATTATYQPGGSFTTNANTTLYAVWGSSNLASGTCGSDLTWTLSNSGVLTVSGSGAMKDYEYKSEMPWYSYLSQINSVVLESGVTSIGSYAFYGAPNLESITIPQSVTAIGSYAFKNAAALDDVVLPSRLSKLGESAFYACTSLSAIDIPTNLYTIQPYTFKNCTALREVTFHEGNLMKISDGAFYNTGLTELTLPDCLSIVDVYAFKNCSKLRSIDLSAGLTQIREAVFYGTAIPTITIPEGVTSIGPYAFKNCTSLTSIELPSTLTSVGEASFYACTALESLELPDAVTKIGNYAFRKCESLLDVHFGSGLTNIGESSFYGCESIVYLAIPGKVNTIQGYAFKGCTNLEIVELPESLNTIGDSAFHTCTSLSEITIPGGVTKIGDYCFSGSTGIDRFCFLGNAPTIGSGTFNKLTATAYYPSGNSTWTASVRQNYGGTITWTAR